MFSRPLTVFLAFLFSFTMPGAGQAFNGQRSRAWIYAVLTLILGLGSSVLLSWRPPASAAGFYVWLHGSGLLRYAGTVLRLIAGSDAARRAYMNHGTLDPRLRDLRQALRFLVGWGALYLVMYLLVLPRLILRTHGPGRAAITHNVPGLARQLTAEEPIRRQAACHALGEIGPGARMVLPDLATVGREDVHPDVRFEALRAMVRIDPQDPETLASSKHALGDPESRTRDLARRTLVAMPDRSLEIFKSLGRDPLSVRRLEAVHALTLIPPSPEVTALLRQAMNDANPEVRGAAQQAVEFSTLPEPQLAVRAHSAHYAERVIALQWMGRRRLHSFGVLQALTRGLLDADREVREAAAGALAALGPRGISALTDGLRSTRSEVRVAALSGLALVRDVPVRGSIEAMLVDQDPDVKQAALNALAEINQAPLIRQDLDDHRTKVHKE